MDRRPGTALLIIGHGSTANPDSSKPTRLLADEIRARGLFDEVNCCFWKEQPPIRGALQQIHSSEVYVVPNFISEGYFTQTVIPRELCINGATTRLDGKTIHYCEPVGNHPSVTTLLLKRARETAPETSTKEASLLIVGHGTLLNNNSSAAVRRQVSLLSETGLYAEVLPAYLEEAPLVSDWATTTRCSTVVVVPFFISDGLHSYQDIPVLLGIRNETGPAAAQSEVFKSNPHHLRGKTLYYGSAFGTDPTMADIILDQVTRFDTQDHLMPPL